MADDKKGGKQVQRDETIVGRPVLNRNEDRTALGVPWQEPLVKTPGLTPDEQAKCNLGLLRAANAGNAEKAERCILEGADPNVRDIKGRTPLMFAVGLQYKHDPSDIELPSGHRTKRNVRKFVIDPMKSVQCAMVINQHGGDLKAKDREGKSVLDHASWNPIIKGAIQGMLELAERMAKE